MERGNCAEKNAPFNLTIYGCDGLEQGELIVRKYIDNMISQFHGIVLMQIGFILAFFAASILQAVYSPTLSSVAVVQALDSSTK